MTKVSYGQIMSSASGAYFQYFWNTWHDLIHFFHRSGADNYGFAVIREVTEGGVEEGIEGGLEGGVEGGLEGGVEGGVK